jgi:hypothetical protein
MWRLTLGRYLSDQTVGLRAGQLTDLEDDFEYQRFDVQPVLERSG